MKADPSVNQMVGAEAVSAICREGQSGIVGMRGTGHRSHRSRMGTEKLSAD